MIKKDYEYEFSMAISKLIETQFGVPDRMFEIFVLGFARKPSEFFKKSFSEMEKDLKQKYNLIQSVEFCLLRSNETLTDIFRMRVTVNASFMPECVDEVCTDYFENTVKKELLKNFSVRYDGAIISDEQAEDIRQVLIRDYGAN
jgi:hypothetical protein